MKKINIIALIASLGIFGGHSAWANGNQALGTRHMTVKEAEIGLNRLNTLKAAAVSTKDSCIADAGEKSVALAQCNADYENRLNDIKIIAQHSGFSKDSGVSAQDILCTEKAQDIANEMSKFMASTRTKNGDDRYNGSSLFQRCSQNTALDWSEIVSRDDPTIWDVGWRNFAEKVAKNFNQSASGCADLQKAVESLPAAVNSFTNELVACEAIRSITSKSDFNDPKQIIGGTQATQASLDQKIKCQSKGAETRDYKACVKTLNFYNGALVGTTVFTQVQELGYQSHTIENSVLDPNDPTAGLKSQKRDIEKRAGMTQTRAGLDMAKGAALLALWRSIPTAQDVTRECIAGVANRETIINQRYNEFVAKMSAKLTVSTSSPPGTDVTKLNLVAAAMEKAQRSLTTTGGSNRIQPEALSKSCQNQVSGQFVILNGSARDSIKEAMILAGIDGLKHQTAASLLKKQANDVGNVINEVDNFNPTGLEYFGEEFSGSECALNPAAEGCDEFVDRRSFGFGNSAPIQIHGIKNASNFGRSNSTSPTGSRDSETSPVDRSDAPTPIGIFDTNADNPSGILDPQRAATATSDGPGGASGGGGGGVAGSGSPPAAPGGAPGAQAPRMGLPGAGSSNLTYSESGGYIRPGSRAALRRGANAGDDDENPFASLFGKENPEGGANLNFRGAASQEGEINTPDTSIFEIISERYIAVHSNDRLLMYEAQEESNPLE